MNDRYLMIFLLLVAGGWPGNIYRGLARQYIYMALLSGGCVSLIMLVFVLFPSANLTLHYSGCLSLHDSVECDAVDGWLAGIISNASSVIVAVAVVELCMSVHSP